MKTQQQHHLSMNLNDAAAYVIGGKALFTVQNAKTGTRFTFKVVANEQKTVYWVKALTGSDNESSYTYIGFVRANALGTFLRSGKISAQAPSAVYAEWLFRHLYAPSPSLRNAEVFHHGTCGCCGRTLTDPESIIRGIGPVCMGKHVRLAVA